MESVAYSQSKSEHLEITLPPCALSPHPCSPVLLCNYRKRETENVQEAFFQTQTYRVCLFWKGYAQVTRAEVTCALYFTLTYSGEHSIQNKTKRQTNVIIQFGLSVRVFVEFGIRVTSAYNLSKHHTGSQKAV